MTYFKGMVLQSPDGKLWQVVDEDSCGYVEITRTEVHPREVLDREFRYMEVFPCDA